MKPEKQKLLIIGALGAVLVGVGAFQLIPRGSSSPAPKKAAATTAQKAETPEEKLQRELQGLVAGPLPQRDPFAPQALPSEPKENVAVPQPPAPQPHRPRAHRARSESSAEPSGMPPLSPLIGQLPAIGAPGQPGIGIEGAAPLRTPDEPAFEVKGVVLGAKPMAVFEDDKGRQRLVPLGGSVDGESRVVSIDRGRVKVKHRGKHRVLTVKDGTREK